MGGGTSKENVESEKYRNSPSIYKYNAVHCMVGC
jgi:hypothetical protein